MSALPTTPPALSPAPAPATTLRAAPPTALLARPEVAILPWIVLAVCLLAGGFSEWLKDDAAGRDWLAIYGALGGSIAAMGLAVAQHLAAERRPGSSAWIYIGGTALVVV